MLVIAQDGPNGRKSARTIADKLADIWNLRLDRNTGAPLAVKHAARQAPRERRNST